MVLRYATAPMAKRVLVLSAAVGAGHMRAAQAVELALRQTDLSAQVSNIDVLTLTNAAFRRIYGEAYLDLVNKAPHVLGLFYDLMDRPRKADSKRDALRTLVDRINLTKLTDVLTETPWDVIVNTHFLPAELIAGLRRRRKLKTPQMTVTTDFETHRMWVNTPCDLFTTATAEAAAYLASFGVDADSIRVTGIPIHPNFSKPAARAECLAAQGLVGDRPVILQLAGGFGVGPVEKIFRSLLEVKHPIEIAVVTGRNAKAKAQIEQIEVPNRHRVKVLGFTDKIDELMGAADIVVSKPGGLTTSECLARGAAMAVVNPIPGQESRNSDFLLENGAAIKINNIATMPMKLNALLDDPRRLQTLKSNAARIATPRAAFDIANLAFALAGKS